MTCHYPTITLYDAPSSLEEKTLSPFVGRTRLLLNYKKIPFNVEWISFPDIEAVCKSMGVPPSGEKKDGTPHYTVPFIKVDTPADSSEPNTIISGSLSIANYIEKLFPEPSVFPEGTRVYRALLEQFITEKLMLTAYPLVITDICKVISSGDWYLRTRDAALGVPLTSMLPKDEAGEELLREKVKQGLDALAKAMDEDGKGNCRLTKNKVTYAEMELVATLYCMKRVSPARLWDHVKDNNEGRWEKLVESYSMWLPLRGT